MIKVILNNHEKIKDGSPVISLHSMKNNAGPDSCIACAAEYGKFTVGQKNAYDDFVSFIQSQLVEKNNNAFVVINNNPTYEERYFSLDISINGTSTGFSPVQIEYSKLSVENRKKIQSFVDFIRELSVLTIENRKIAGARQMTANVVPVLKQEKK